MVKPLTFKGDKRKRKKHDHARDDDGEAKRPRPDDDHEDNDEAGWVTAGHSSEVNGPVMLLIGGERGDDDDSPLRALASDAHGNVFLMDVLATSTDEAEPHDVRMVFVASRPGGGAVVVAGAGSKSTSTSAQAATSGLCLKSHDGSYLGCDRAGILAATKQALGSEEMWTLEDARPATDVDGDADGQPDALVPYGDRSARLKTSRGTYVGAAAGAKAARGDYDTPAAATRVVVRMQRGFVPKQAEHAAGGQAAGTAVRDANVKISRLELEKMAGRALGDDEVKALRRARKGGGFYEAMLDAKVKGKHDKFA